MRLFNKNPKCDLCRMRSKVIHGGWCSDCHELINAIHPRKELTTYQWIEYARIWSKSAWKANKYLRTIFNQGEI